MKKVIFILLTLASVTAKAQIDLRLLKGLVINISFDQIDKELRKAGYPFEKTTNKNIETGECRQYYQFKKTIDAPLPYTELVVVFTKCTDNPLKIFTGLRFITRNEETFYALKTQCTSEENISLESEAAKDGSVIWTYKKGNYTFVFDNGSDSNGKVYMLDVLYNSAIKN
jgi:hypothetical protein